MRNPFLHQGSPGFAKIGVRVLFLAFCNEAVFALQTCSLQQHAFPIAHNYRFIIFYLRLIYETYGYSVIPLTTLLFFFLKGISHLLLSISLNLQQILFSDVTLNLKHLVLQKKACILKRFICPLLYHFGLTGFSYLPLLNGIVDF